VDKRRGIFGLAAKIIILAGVVCISARAASAASPKAQDERQQNELQGLCAKDAEEFFKKEFGDRYTFTNHYSNKLHKCFLLVTYNEIDTLVNLRLQLAEETKKNTGEETHEKDDARRERREMMIKLQKETMQRQPSFSQSLFDVNEHKKVARLELNGVSEYDLEELLGENPDMYGKEAAARVDTQKMLAYSCSVCQPSSLCPLFIVAATKDELLAHWSCVKRMRSLLLTDWQQFLVPYMGN